MKTQIIALFAALVLSSGLAATTYAGTVKNENVTVLTDVAGINKIEVHGNVELYISDGAADQVKVYNKYYAESALVQSKNGVLRISSYKAEKLVVWVTANDLRSVSAYDNAEVKSFGDLSKIDFEVDLHNTASAQLNIEAYSASVTIYDQAKISLAGRATVYTLKYNNAENVSQTNFASVNESKTLTNSVTKVNADDLVDL